MRAGVPWFWSDQYDVKLQIAGVATGFDHEVRRGDVAQGRSFAVFYFKDGQLIAVDAVNDPKSFMFGKLAITKRLILDAKMLADPDVPHKSSIQ